MSENHVVQIGQNVRRLREQRGMNINELGDSAELSRQMVALIERGESNPSVATIARIAQALGVDLATLVEVPSGPEARLIEAETYRMLWHDDSGNTGKLIVSSSIASKSVEMWVWELAANTTYHATGEMAEEFLFVVKGSVSLNWGAAETIHVLAGNSAKMPLHQPYSVTASKHGQARFLLVYVPG
jgi:transcriptional regulator with XRE-family HTH domain